MPMCKKHPAGVRFQYSLPRTFQLFRRPLLQPKFDDIFPTPPTSFDVKSLGDFALHRRYVYCVTLSGRALSTLKRLCLLCRDVVPPPFYYSLPLFVSGSPNTQAFA
jgi:hypothetical protein